MLKLTSTLLNGLNKLNDNPVLRFVTVENPESSGSESAEVIPSTIDTIPKKRVRRSGADVTAVGSNLPMSIFEQIKKQVNTAADRLIPFYRSPARAEAFITGCLGICRMLNPNITVPENYCCSSFNFEKTNKGQYRWYLKRDDRERGYYSPLYDDTDLMKADFMTLARSHCAASIFPSVDEAINILKDYILDRCADVMDI